MKANAEIRAMAAENNVKHWEIARSLGVSEATFVRWLRVPMTQEVKARVIETINILAQR